MPQFDQIGEIYASQLFWLAVFFGLIFVVVGLGMLPKIQSTVDARDARIAADLKQAEEARQHADALEDAYRERMDKSRAEAARLAADAKESGARSTEARVAEADQALNARIEEAEARIAVARTAALSEIEAVAAEAAQAMAERVAGLSLDPATVRSAVQQELVRG
jgi:F-type H+-transporting ATPase subunit b